MTPSTISQPVNNVQLPSQTGGGFVVKQNVNFRGGDALIGFSASGWSNNGYDNISMQLWIDGEPIPAGLLSLWARPPKAHLALGHAWAWVPGIAPGTHTVALMAGDTTTTDQNDTACITIWELGDNLAVRLNESIPSPTGTGQPLVKTTFQTHGTTPILVSAAMSGQALQVAGILGATVAVDEDTNAAANLEVFQNFINVALPAVPTDVQLAPPSRGSHELQLTAESATSTNQNDMVHLTVVEWVDPAQGPTLVQLSPPLQNAPAANTHGDGDSIASATFTSSGGTLLVRTNLSAWSPTTDVLLQAGIQIDGTTRGVVQAFENISEMHVPLVSNDLVITGIPAGQHTLNLIAEVNTYTDANDRVSVTILEF